MSSGPGPDATGQPEERARVLLYSDDRITRQNVRLAVGRRPAVDVPLVEFVEVATHAAVLKEMDAGGISVAILDGEASPSGGLGLARQLKDEIYRCPPVLALIGRPHDAWLATWSRADAVVAHPLDPLAVARALADLLRRQSAVTS